MRKIRAHHVMLAVGALLVLACQDRTRPTTSPLAAIGSPRDSIFDVPITQVSLPPEPRPFDNDDVALETAIQNVGGRAVVAFKDSASPRFGDVGGHRAAIPAYRTREGLAVLRAAGAEVLQVYGVSAMAYVRLAAGTSGAVRHHPLIDFVEPVPSGITHKSLISMPAVSPGAGSVNRAGFALSGQTVPWGVTMVNAPTAWSITRGTSATVMIMSSGVNAHPDLPAIPSGNCGGYFNSCSSQFTNGTFLAGVVTALDNSIGVVGVSPGVQGSNLYSWRIYDDSAQINWSLYLAGMNAAPQMGIKTVLTDWLYVGFWQSDATAIAAAWAAGTIVVAGVGDGARYETDIYPASYTNVVGVAGVRDDRTSASSATPGCTIYPGSNYGPYVVVAAPYWAYSTATTNTGYPTYFDSKADDGWCTNDIASAHVAGVIALLRDHYPTWTPTDIVQKLTSTASLGGSRNDYLGHGIVDAGAALGYVPLSVTISGPRRVKPNQNCGWWANPAGGTPPYSYSWSPPGSSGGDPNEVIESFSGSGTVYLTASVYDALNHAAMAKDTITVTSSAPNCVY